MSHYIWNDRENTYVITGRLGARILAIRQTYAGVDRRLSISVDDDTKPDDIMFVENFYDCDKLFMGFRVFISGKPFDVTMIAAKNIAFTENPYVEPANILISLSKMIGLKSVADTTIEKELLNKLKYLKIIEDNKLMDLVKLCYEQQQTINKLNQTNDELSNALRCIKHIYGLD